MNKKLFVPPIVLLILSVLLSACIGLIPLDEEPVTGEFGPKTSLQEQQTNTFEALWKNIEDNYIYFENTSINWDAMHDEYVKRIGSGLTTEEFTALIKDLESELPKGSLVYQSRQDRIVSDMTDTSSYGGIGVFIGFNDKPEPHIVLLAVMEGSPAAKAGLQAHDSIFAIDGNPVLLEEGVNAAERVRGPTGSSVTLQIETPGTPPRSVEVIRGKLAGDGKLAAYEVQGTNYGYLLFPPVAYSTLTEDVTQSLQKMTTNRKLDGLILDLRIAGSIRGWPLQAIGAMFDNGAMGEFYNRSEKQTVKVEGQDVFSSQTVPLVVLVGRNTTGAPEILAASLQSHKRAIVIGEKTSGSIEESSPFYLPDGSQAYIETTSFVLSNGDYIGNTGVIPNIQLDQGWEDVLPNRDPVVDRAIITLGE